MNLLDAALSLLAALEDFNEQSKHGIALPAEIDTAMDKLREFIAAAEKVEPVAKFSVTADGYYALIFANDEVRRQQLKPGAMFYTAPPADVVRMRDRIENLRGALKTASGRFLDANDLQSANDCMEWAGDMEPAIGSDVVRDAERYRWLRGQHQSDLMPRMFVVDSTGDCVTHELDAAIDEAMKKEPGA